MGRYGWGGGVLAALLVLSGLAFGEQGSAREAESPSNSNVVVNIEPCINLDLDAVERLSALEFPSAASSQMEYSHQAQVNVGCSSGTVVVVVNVNAETTLTRQLDLSSEPPGARERLLALLIGEAVAAVRTQGGTAPTTPREVGTEQVQRNSRSLEP